MSCNISWPRFSSLPFHWPSRQVMPSGFTNHPISRPNWAAIFLCTKYFTTGQNWPAVFVFFYLAVRFQIFLENYKKKLIIFWSQASTQASATSDTGKAPFNRKKLECWTPPRRYNFYSSLKLIICHEINHCPTLSSSSKVLRADLIILQRRSYLNKHVLSIKLNIPSSNVTRLEGLVPPCRESGPLHKSHSFW